MPGAYPQGAPPQIVITLIENKQGQPNFCQWQNTLAYLFTLSVTNKRAYFCAIGFFFKRSSDWQKSPVEYWFIKIETQVFIQKMMAWLKLNKIKSVIKMGAF